MANAADICEGMEPHLADVVLGDATTEVRALVVDHCRQCRACTVALENATTASAFLQIPNLDRPAPRVRDAVFERVRRDLAPASPRRVATALIAGALGAVVGLVVAGARAPLAAGVPLLVCGAAWTAAIGLGVVLVSMRATATRWPVAALGGVGAALVMSIVCPPTTLVDGVRGAGWFGADGVGAELFVGLAFGVAPALVAVGIARRGISLAAATAVAGLLLAAELPLLFAQCCTDPTVRALPVLAGALGGALSISAITTAFARARGEHRRNAHV